MLTKSNQIGNESGPQAGQAYGQGSSFKNEKTSMKREKIRSNVGPQGTIIGTLDIDGEAPRGEVAREHRQVVEKAMQQLAEEVETEPLPIEHRQHVGRYRGRILEMFQGGGGDSTDED